MISRGYSVRSSRLLPGPHCPSALFGQPKGNRRGRERLRTWPLELAADHPDAHRRPVVAAERHEQRWLTHRRPRLTAPASPRGPRARPATCSPAAVGHGLARRRAHRAPRSSARTARTASASSTAAPAPAATRARSPGSGSGSATDRPRPTASGCLPRAGAGFEAVPEENALDSALGDRGRGRDRRPWGVDLPRSFSISLPEPACEAEKPRHADNRGARSAGNFLVFLFLSTHYDW